MSRSPGSLAFARLKDARNNTVLHATVTNQGPVSRSPGNFSGPDRCFVLVVFAFKIKVSIIFKNNTIKLSVNEAKVTGLWDRNCATFQQVVILKFAFGPEKFPGLSRNGPQKFSFHL